MKYFLLSLLCAVVFSVCAHAQDSKIETYKFDKLHTQILFAVDHLGFTKSYGMFTGFDGSVVLDRAHLENSKVDVTIKTGSLDLNDKTWNEHVSGENLLKTALFPDAVFKSTSIILKDNKSATMTGDFTLLGVTKPLTLDVVFNKEGFIKFIGKHAIGFSARGTLKRSDWGMVYGLPDVGDDVTLIIEAALEREDKVQVNQ